MNRQELAKRVSRKIGTTHSLAEQLVEATFEAVAEALVDGNDVRAAMIGRFSPKRLPERKWANNVTGETGVKPPCREVKFYPSKLLKAAVNGEVDLAELRAEAEEERDEEEMLKAVIEKYFRFKCIVRDDEGNERPLVATGKGESLEAAKKALEFALDEKGLSLVDCVHDTEWRPQDE